MRILLVGSPRERERLKPQLASGFEIVGEFPNIGVARQSRTAADVIVLALEPSERELPEPLTPREREVLDLLVEGLSNKVIGARLGISDQTVKFHVAAICGKLGAANRTDAVRHAIRRGLVAV